MAREKLSPEERKKRKAERNREYWESHKEEIAEKRKKKRIEDKARDKQYQEQVNAFISDINADKDIQNAMKAILDGNDPKTVLSEYAKNRGAERE